MEYTIKTQQDEDILKSDLQTLDGYSEQWLLRLNVVKCQKMSIGHDLDTHYTLKQESSVGEIEQVKSVRDLGILVSDDLKWSHQCNQAAAKATSTLGMIRRTFNDLSIEAFESLY